MLWSPYQYLRFQEPPFACMYLLRAIPTIYTLLGGTQTDIQDRKDRGSSDERPYGRDETESCYRPKACCRVDQRAIRQAKAEHTAAYSTTE